MSEHAANIVATVFMCMAGGFGIVSLVRSFIPDQPTNFHLQTIAQAVACCALALTALCWKMLSR